VVIFIMLLLSAYNNFLDFGKLCQDG
jgi:hypothetical protein